MALSKNTLHLRYSTDYRIKSIFKKEGIPIRITHKATLLRQVLRPTDHTQLSCDKSECPTATINLCFTNKNVVCPIGFTQFKQSHIGSTIRNLHDRVKEHLTRSASSVYKNFINKHHEENIRDKIYITIVSKETDTVILRLKEAFYIRKHKPKLNSREELSELTELLFKSYLVILIVLIYYTHYCSPGVYCII